MLIALFVLTKIIHICFGTRLDMFYHNSWSTEMLRKKNNYTVLDYTSSTTSHSESPVWDPEKFTLYWVDVTNQAIHALNYETFEHRVKIIDYGEVNFIIPVANSSRLVAGCRSQIFLIDWGLPGDLALRHVASLDPLSPNNQVNEAKCDARGRLWAGTKGPQFGDEVDHDHGALYKLQATSYLPEIQLKPVSISNGLVWALNNSVLYYIDSATNSIDAFDYDLHKGLISKRRTVLDLSDYDYYDVVPDGMTIDRDGFLWVALFKDGSVIHVDPDTGRIVEKYELPVARVTSMTWAGADLEDLIVTTSGLNVEAKGLNEAPLSGQIFVFRGHGTGGMPDHKFIFENADKY